MRKTLLALLLVALASGLHAQVIQNDVSKAEFDTIQFVCPTFQSGFVFFKDGSRENGAVNIDALFQKVVFISEGGEKKTLSNNDSVDRVIIGKRMFFYRMGKFIELVDTDGEKGLGKVNTISLIEDQKKGAFGMVSETTSIKQVGSLYNEGQFYDMKDFQRINYIQKFMPYLFDNGKFSRVTKKSFIKAYSDRKKEIEAYLDANNVDFESYEDVEKLYNSIK